MYYFIVLINTGEFSCNKKDSKISSKTRRDIKDLKFKEKKYFALKLSDILIPFASSDSVS